MKRTLLKVSFYNEKQLMDVKRDLTRVVRRNKVRVFLLL
jgi:hypothetical protein